MIINFITLGLNLQNLTLVEYRVMSKAKKVYVKNHAECAICGRKEKLEVHHIHPVHVDHKLASDPKNFITLCDPCHFTWGHFGNYRTKYNLLIRECAIISRSFLTQADSRNYIIPTNILIDEFAYNMGISRMDFVNSLKTINVNPALFTV